MNKSLFGLNENIVAALAYLFGFISGIVVLILERDNKYVRFAALQSTIFFIILWLVGGIFGILGSIPLLGFLFSPVIWIFGIVHTAAVIILVITALVGRAVKIPIIGTVAWDQVHK